MGYKCNHGRSFDDIMDAVDCDLRDYMLKTHMLTEGRAGKKKITKWEASLGANGKPLFSSLQMLGKDSVNSMPKELFSMIMGQSVTDIAHLITHHPEVIEDMLNEAKAIHARLSGFKADDAIKAAAAAGSKHTD